MNIDFNADMGESFGMYVMGHDEKIMQYITSANVACGFHAGDPTVMKKTVALAKQYKVQVGAHPGLPDRQGFGRRTMNLTLEEIYDDMVYQIGALKAFAEAAGLRLHHVKPHGSLYGMAMQREEVARAIGQAVLDVDKNLYLYIMKKGFAGPVAESLGLRVVYELYADLDRLTMRLSTEGSELPATRAWLTTSSTSLQMMGFSIQPMVLPLRNLVRHLT